MFNLSPTQKIKFLPVLPAMMLAHWGAKWGYAKPIMEKFLTRITDIKNAEKAFADYQPTAHDVFAATFAKSGTNWLMQITQQIAWLGKAEFNHIHDMIPWPEAPMPFFVGLDNTDAQEKSPTGLRIIKTHLPTNYVPYSEEATYITILRDPKEVLVSGYYFLGGMLGVLPYLTVPDWYDLAMKPGSLMRGWVDHTASFWAWRDRPNVLVLTFNEMKHHTQASITRVAETMGVSLTESQLAQVVEKSSFHYMKQHEDQFSPPRLPFTDKAQGRMIRSGKTGASGELISQEQQVEIDRFCQTELQRIGSDFPYADLFEVVN